MTSDGRNGVEVKSRNCNWFIRQTCFRLNRHPLPLYPISHFWPLFFYPCWLFVQSLTLACQGVEDRAAIFWSTKGQSSNQKCHDSLLTRCETRKKSITCYFAKRDGLIVNFSMRVINFNTLLSAGRNLFCKCCSSQCMDTCCWEAFTLATTLFFMPASINSLTVRTVWLKSITANKDKMIICGSLLI